MPPAMCLAAAPANDQIDADGDKINAGAGNDKVDISVYGGQRVDVTLGSGNDRLEIYSSDQDFVFFNQNRIDVRRLQGQ